MPPAKNSKPKLSIILLAPANYERIQKVISCYRAQTVVKEIELVIATSDRTELHFPEEEMRSFHSHQVVEIAETKYQGVYKSAAIAIAKADVIVFGEDHSFPLVTWAAALIERHKGPWAAVGPRIANPNPNTRRGFSWAQSYMEYGLWVTGERGGQSDYLAGHNSSFKKKILLAYGESLPYMLESEYILFEDIRRNGHKLFFEVKAVTRHLNFEKFVPLMRVRYLVGRQFAASRTPRWSWTTKLAYILGSPLIPMVRLVRIIQMMKTNNEPPKISIYIFGSLVINLIPDFFGQLMGYAFGLGNATEELFPLEFHRGKYLIDKDVLQSICTK